MARYPRRPRVRDLDDAAVWAEVVANLDLVGARARHYHRPGSILDVEDLVGEGLFGLYRAVELFDPAWGCQLSTYATPWINRAIRHAIADFHGSVRIPTDTARLATRVEDGRLDPATLDPGRRLDVEAALTVRRAAIHAGQTGARGADRAVARPDHAPDEVPPEVLAALARLSDRARTILRARFGLGRPKRTLREVADAEGISSERVRQIEERTLVLVRTSLAVPT